MAPLYPTYQPNTCLISNGLSTMAFAVPGPQELETAMRERVPFAVLIWDNAYGLIKWKMDTELGHHAAVDFSNPDLVKYAESFGAKGCRIEAAADLLPTVKKALADDTVSVLACPVDYSENTKLTEKHLLRRERGRPASRRGLCHADDPQHFRRVGDFDHDESSPQA